MMEDSLLTSSVTEQRGMTSVVMSRHVTFHQIKLRCAGLYSTYSPNDHSFDQGVRCITQDATL